MNAFTKKPLTIDEQLSLLIARGLIIEDEERTKRHLQNIGYFRLSAYMKPFMKEKSSEEVQEKFIENTTWSHIYDTYLFDRKLRLLVFDNIERIEVALRAQLVNKLSLKYGAHWHDKHELFKLPKHSKIQSIFEFIQEHICKLRDNTHPEKFIEYYYREFTTPETPPCWMIAESMYFKHLSMICEYLDKRKDRTAIASSFCLPEGVFVSWLHSVHYVRNICAHHSRLWNRKLDVQPAVLNKGSITTNKVWIDNASDLDRKQLYYFLCTINYLLQTVNPNSHFKEKLILLLSKHSHVIQPADMGFPTNWLKEEIWKISG